MILLLLINSIIYALVAFLLIVIKERLDTTKERLNDLESFLYNNRQRIQQIETDFAYLVDEDLKKERLSVRKQREFQEALRRMTYGK